MASQTFVMSFDRAFMAYVLRAMQKLHLAELSRHTFAKAIEAEKTVICSPHELIAVVTFAHDVVVYRLNGQIAFTIKNPDDDDGDVEDDDRLRVARAEWSPDGRRLAIAWSDGSWRIHEAEKGDPVFEGTVREDDDAVVLGMSWQQHLVQMPEKQAGYRTSATLSADFPREVTLFDITDVLPRLSALPAHGLRMSTEGAKFAHQSSTDGIFAMPATQGRDGTAEVLLIHVSNGTIRIMLNGTSHVGTVEVSQNVINARYASTASSGTHALLAAPEAATLHLELLDLPLDDLNGAVLHLTSHSTMQLCSLLQYIRRTTQCILHDYTTGTAMPDRMVNNISMTLEDNPASACTLSSALLHLAMTGQFQPDVLEWLTDIVKDTGLKRWDTSINTMYASIQTHLHSHILPAIDRMTIAASKLRGLARFHQGSAAFTPDEQLFSTIIDKSDSLRETALRGLQICIGEWASWRVFSRWLKMQIEVASAGPNTKEAAETEEREGLGIDFALVVQYTQTVLRNGSELRSYVTGKAEDNLSSIVASTDAAIGEALMSITNWQGRFFTTARSLTLDHAGEALADMRLRSASEGSLSVDMTTIDQESVVSLRSYSIPNTGTKATRLEATPKQLRAKVFLAKMYRSGRHLLCLEQSSPSEDYPFQGLQLATYDLTNKRASVLHHFDNKNYAKPEQIMVGGRDGKEFCVVVGEACRSLTILDLYDRSAFTIKREDPEAV
ncbi:hypothetical protein AMS68_002049 [Peltaster fructicola]|uniref:Anaphase-promoting complex subunit 4 n=1 Tax=Peltaster fructicola TaxID=286661 RepID=A0A6H0XP44_9PEZI|nr:hypothetical protein AMS68_002049 [Peltaster fructicola]